MELPLVFPLRQGEHKMRLKFSAQNLKIFLSAVTLLVLLLVWVFLVLLPFLEKIGSTVKKTKENEESAAKLVAQISEFRQLSQEFAKIQDEMRDLTAVFPRREEMVSLVKGLESATARAGSVHELALKDSAEEQEMQGGKSAGGAGGNADANPMVVAALAGAEQVPYSLHLTGENYRKFLDFLIYLENLPFYTEVKQLTVTADSAQDGETQILHNIGSGEMVLEGVLFLKKPQSGEEAARGERIMSLDLKKVKEAKAWLDARSNFTLSPYELAGETSGRDNPFAEFER